MEVVHPRWSAWSFLVYAGGFTVLSATAAWLTYLAAHSGGAGYAGWTLLVYALLAVKAAAFRRSGHPVAAGVFAFVAVVVAAGVWLVSSFREHNRTIECLETGHHNCVPLDTSVKGPGG